jgi:hypothetical protein
MGSLVDLPEYMMSHPRKQYSSKVKLLLCLSIIPSKCIRKVAAKLYTFLTMALDGTEWSNALATLPTRRNHPVPNGQEAG